MQQRKKPMNSIGFWNGIEGNAGTSVRRRPEVILSTVPSDESELVMGNEQFHLNIYATILPMLKILNPESPVSVVKFKCQCLCKLEVAPKKESSAQNIHLTLYHVKSDVMPDMHFYFLIDENQAVAAYARYAYYANSKYVKSFYSDSSFISLDAIESMRRGDYSLGSVLVQTVFENSLRENCEGRMVVLSANKSGEFFFKLGFTPIKEEIFDKLYNQGEETDGQLMFLTNSAIDAWIERVKAHPILSSSLQLGNQVDTQVTLK